MKHWLETRQVLDRLAQLRLAGQRAALATVVRVRGSAYRRPGARMVVAEDGSSVGNVSGGCLEADVREVALLAIADGRARLRRYCSGADEVEAWDLGVGCEGEVEVYVEPAADERAEVRTLLGGDAPFAVCSLVAEGEVSPGRLLVTADGTAGTLGDPALDAEIAGVARSGLGEDGSELFELDGRAVFVERLRPPPLLLVCGAGDDARPLVRLAREIGFRVAVADRRPAMLTEERFPGARLVRARADQLADRLDLPADAMAVLMAHSYADDRDHLRALLPFALPYIGMLGPRQRTERILAGLSAEGIAIDESRIFGPIGLDIGTEGAEQVAVAIVGELLAARSGRGGMPLRDRVAPIHAALP